MTKTMLAQKLKINLVVQKSLLKLIKRKNKVAKATLQMLIIKKRQKLLIL